ncbi:hypothetical protein Zmor_011813 [Zophobas morio]|uniref:Phosphate acetyl/butaryl transferase domain-containing protein n=1 Tax=Zophobas morio TaxID=2755281 RepID=A0AA38LZU2_9CUCU|nr:hypothetical protein Zmor_011813 [Zophobas morio]
MLLKRGDVDCMLCGIDYTTADTLRPALQIIKTKPNTKIASSIILMNRDNETYFFADCSLNVDPTSEQLADIAKSSADFCKQMGLKDPQVAMLCYSTNGSGMGPTVDRVSEACKILSNEKVDFVFDGEIQFDAAFVKSVRDKKYKETKITKDSADIYVFPDLASGNIGYKIAQRLGNFDSVGPFILGLQKPVNDLSRGATLEDVVLSAIYTLFQSIA